MDMQLITNSGTYSTLGRFCRRGRSDGAGQSTAAIGGGMGAVIELIEQISTCLIHEATNTKFFIIPIKIPVIFLSSPFAFSFEAHCMSDGLLK